MEIKVGKTQIAEAKGRRREERRERKNEGRKENKEK